MSKLLLALVALFAVVCAVAAVSSDVEATRAIIDSHSVVVFSKSYCPFCKRAKGLLESLNIEFHAVELDQHANGRGIQAALLDLTGQRTVPNIWINGNHIGGSDLLHELHAKGGLLPLVAKKPAN